MYAALLHWLGWMPETTPRQRSFALYIGKGGLLRFLATSILKTLPWMCCTLDPSKPTFVSPSHSQTKIIFYGVQFTQNCNYCFIDCKPGTTHLP